LIDFKLAYAQGIDLC